MGVLMLGAIGVVFGDIGTSPLYTMREVFGGPHRLEFTPGNVYGLLSVVFWALVVIVTLKYVVLIMRADNRGEGGILALAALAASGFARDDRTRWWLVGFGIFGAAMFFGDAMITPAVSVLGAIEGLEVMTPALKPYIVPIALVILVALFAIQKRGTGSVGVLFGPVCAIWFLVLAVLGAIQIAAHPKVLVDRVAEALAAVDSVTLLTDFDAVAVAVLDALLVDPIVVQTLRDGRREITWPDDPAPHESRLVACTRDLLQRIVDDTARTVAERLDDLEQTAMEHR